MYYAESRFRAALLAISELTKEQQAWKQKFLCAEVELILFFIGQASALGLPIIIPIIVWSLAALILGVPLDQYPLKLSNNLLRLLDAGVDKDSLVWLVDNYLHDWWNSGAEISMDYTLKPIVIAAALQMHAGSGLQKIVTDSLPKPSGMSVPTISYLMTISSSIQASQTKADANAKFSMRRAAGFHLVHEAVVLKEQQTGDPVPIDEESVKRSASGPYSRATSKTYPNSLDDVLITRRSQCMAMNAADQLSMLKSLPTSSQKWTWGAELTPTDLMALAVDPLAQKLPHSGYSHSLPEGCIHREWSSNPTHPTELSVVSAIGAETADLAAIPSIPDVIGLLPTICHTTWQNTDSIAQVNHTVRSHSVPIQTATSVPMAEVLSAPVAETLSAPMMEPTVVPIDHISGIGIQSTSVPNLDFVASASDAATVWNTSSGSSNNSLNVHLRVSPTTMPSNHPSRSMAAQVAAVWLRDSSDNESSTNEAEEASQVDAADFSAAWAISSDDNLASDEADPDNAHFVESNNLANSLENLHIGRFIGPSASAAMWSDSSDSGAEDVLGPIAYPGNTDSVKLNDPAHSFEHPHIDRHVGASEAAAVWSDSSVSGAEDVSGPVAGQQSISIHTGSITFPIGPAEVADVWYSSDEDESLVSQLIAPANRPVSPAESSMSVVYQGTNVDTVTISKIRNTTERLGSTL
ncbi:hypothetical protein CVT25_008686 [Psilocybe cyanescens]|uniref:Uncharacterized protein n=1 Tax=Psilocybe cyanescens TaxID=93625 RepID=A0A409XNS4_PSICY|nr:hypothetical protein CVT25_008686 [Psilocybe cyanescens]